MGDLCKDRSKCLLEVNGKPILEHVLDFWGPMAEQVVVVCRPQDADEVRRLVWAHPMVYDVDEHMPVVAAETVGPVDSVLRALEAVRAPRRFVVALGDCLWDGEFEFDWVVESGKDWMGIGVQHDRMSAWGRSYAVYSEASVGAPGEIVRTVLEKPATGLGAYFLSWLALPALERHRRDSMTDVVAELIRQGYWLRPIPFVGNYRNVTYQQDLEGWP